MYDLESAAWERRRDEPEQRELVTRIAGELANVVAPPGPVADLGCGPGAHALARRGYDVTGVDGSPRMVQVARTRAARDKAGATFDVHDVSAPLRFADASLGVTALPSTGGRLVSDDYVWSNLARDLLAFADTLSPEDPIDFIGASLGTGTLLWSAVTAPHRFKRLVLTLPSTAWQTRPAQAALYRELAAVAETDGKDAVIARLTGNSPPPVLAERFAELADSPEAPPAMLPDISSELLPWVMRGAADSDYPDPEAIAALAQPVLILAEAGDPGHPESTARRLHELLPQSELHIASHLPEMRAWGERIDAFLD
jgi:3-oxoadipate enol-lactonase